MEELKIKHENEDISQFIDESLASGKTFIKIYNEGVKKFFPKDFDLRKLLLLLREKGKLSYEIDSNVIDNIRSINSNDLHFDSNGREINFLDYLEEKVEKKNLNINKEEKEKFDRVLQQYKEISKEYHFLYNLYLDGKLPEDKEKRFEELEKIRYEINSLVIHTPANFFLHFVNNNDLKFLWNINEKSTIGSVLNDSGYFRVGDSQSVEW